MTEQTDLKWYAVHTYSGFENKAKKTLEERIQQYGLQDQFGEIWVPMEVVEEIKSGVRKSQSRKCFPSYMLVQMVFSDETAHLVRNTAKVTGFVGNAKKPPALSVAEVDRMRAMVHGTPKIRAKIEFVEGDQVKVIEGPFANFSGGVEEVKPDKQKLRVLVSIFGRATPVELDYAQVERIA
ncbi:MAG: transcription termination/antitermination protein NusG [Myxococcaceae bacterium]